MTATPCAHRAATSATVVTAKPTRNSQVSAFDVSNSECARVAAIRISTSMNPATWSRIRIALHRRSHHAPTPATPSAKIAPSMRAVRALRCQGQTATARAGNTIQKHAHRDGRHAGQDQSPRCHRTNARGGVDSRVILPLVAEEHREHEERCGEVQGDPQPERDVVVQEPVPMQDRRYAHQRRERARPVRTRRRPSASASRGPPGRRSTRHRGRPNRAPSATSSA